MDQNDKGTQLRETLLGESLLFSLLGRALYNPPEKGWLDPLIQEDIFTEVPFGAGQKETQRGQELLHDWAQAHAGGLGEESLKDLKADYTRLFVGAGKVLAPPWESVYFNEDRMIFQEQTLDVRNWYLRFGLELENIHKEPDDHIGLELTFIAYLAELGAKALESEDDEKVERLNDAKRQFLSRHLLLWGSTWCALVVKHAKTEFYRGLGTLTMGALLALAEQYELQLPDRVAG